MRADGSTDPDESADPGGSADPCANTPCMNDGTCIAVRHNATDVPYVCHCPEGIHGKYCEIGSYNCAI